MEKSRLFSTGKHRAGGGCLSRGCSLRRGDQYFKKGRITKSRRKIFAAYETREGKTAKCKGRGRSNRGENWDSCKKKKSLEGGRRGTPICEPLGRRAQKSSVLISTDTSTEKGGSGPVGCLFSGEERGIQNPSRGSAEWKLPLYPS